MVFCRHAECTQHHTVCGILRLSWFCMELRHFRDNGLHVCILSFLSRNVHLMMMLMMVMLKLLYIFWVRIKLTDWRGNEKGVFGSFVVPQEGYEDILPSRGMTLRYF